MSLLCIMVVFPAFLMGGLAIARGMRGTPSLSEPRCARCNYDLRGFSGSAPTRCSECGAELGARGAVLWGKNQRSAGRIWIGVAVGIAPVLIFPLLFLGFRASSRFGGSGPGSPGFSARSNAAVIASLATSANTPWDWQELQRRLTAGKLSNAEVAQAIDQLIAALKTTTNYGPFSWSSSFFTDADSAGKITAEQYQRLARAFYKSCTVAMAGTTRAGAKLRITVQSGGAWQIPGDELVYAVRQVSLSGGGSPQTVLLSNRNDDEPSNPDWFSAKSFMPIRGDALMNVPPGKYALTFTLDVGVLRAGTAPQTINDLPGQAVGWPKGRAAWMETITVPINVVPENQSAITLMGDPKLDPNKTGAVHIKNINAIRKVDGHRVILEMSIDGSAVPVSFDVWLRVGGMEYPAGSCVAWANSFAAGEMACDVPTLDPTINVADVLLRPDPKLVEGKYPVDRIWGQEVDVLNVPLKRYDLPGK